MIITVAVSEDELVDAGICAVGLKEAMYDRLDLRDPELPGYHINIQIVEESEL